MGGALIKTDLGHGRGWASPKAAASIRRIDAQLGRLADINEAGRSPEQANENRRRWLAYERYLNGGPWAPKAPYALGADQSVHCTGDAADSDDWYNAHAAAVWRDNGWRQTARYFDRAGRPTAKDEPWHGEYFEHLDNHRNDPVPTGAVAAAPKFKENEMALIRWKATGAIFVLGFEKILYVNDPNRLPSLRQRHGQEIECDNADLTEHLVSENIPWNAVELALVGRATRDNGRFWSRLTAEGEAIRAGQRAAGEATAKSQKTLEDVLKTAMRIEQTATRIEQDG